MKEIETAQTTPEQLLRLLDAQMEMQRTQRSSRGRNRAALLAGGVLFILIAAGVALLVLAQMLADLPPGGRRESISPPAENF